MKVDGEADSPQCSTSEGVNGCLLPHLSTEVGEEGRLDVGWAVLLISAQDLQLEILCSEHRGGVGCRSNVPGTTKTKATHVCGELSLLPLGVVKWPAQDARDCLPGDVVTSLPAQLMVGGVSGAECVHDLAYTETRSQQTHTTPWGP